MGEIGWIIIELLVSCILGLLLVFILTSSRQRTLERLRHCSDQELPEALLFYLRVRGMSHLAAMSVYFGRPDEEILTALAQLQLASEVEEVLEPAACQDSGFRTWRIITA